MSQKGRQKSRWTTATVSRGCTWFKYDYISWLYNRGIWRKEVFHFLTYCCLTTKKIRSSNHPNTCLAPKNWPGGVISVRNSYCFSDGYSKYIRSKLWFLSVDNWRFDILASFGCCWIHFSHCYCHWKCFPALHDVQGPEEVSSLSIISTDRKFKRVRFNDGTV